MQRVGEISSFHCDTFHLSPASLIPERAHLEITYLECPLVLVWMPGLWPPRLSVLPLWPSTPCLSRDPKLMFLKLLLPGSLAGSRSRANTKGFIPRIPCMCRWSRALLVSRHRWKQSHCLITQEPHPLNIMNFSFLLVCFICFLHENCQANHKWAPITAKIQGFLHEYTQVSHCIAYTVKKDMTNQHTSNTTVSWHHLATAHDTEYLSFHEEYFRKWKSFILNKST